MAKTVADPRVLQATNQVFNPSPNFTQVSYGI